MSSPSRKAKFLNLLIVPWVVTWVLIVPLFHIHTLDIQEDLSRFQAFLPHTVFSPDLPGEYSVRTTAGSRGRPWNQHTVSSHLLQYSEMAIVLFSKDDDTKRKFGISPIHHAHFPSRIHPPTHVIRSAILEVEPPPLLLLQSSGSSRAPPSISF